MPCGYCEKLVVLKLGQKFKITVDNVNHDNIMKKKESSNSLLGRLVPHGVISLNPLHRFICKISRTRGDCRATCCVLSTLLPHYCATSWKPIIGRRVPREFPNHYTLFPGSPQINPCPSTGKFQLHIYKDFQNKSFNRGQKQALCNVTF